jgi:predicted transcriptional regulator
MTQSVDDLHQRWLVKIGKQIRKLRKERTKMGYIEFSKQVGMDKKTYYKMERGEGDFNISSLMRIISFYPELTMQEFFAEAEL